MAPGPARRRTWGSTMGRDPNAVGDGVAVTAGRELRERRPAERRRPIPPVDAVFCWYGPVVASRSPRWSHPRGGVVESVVAHLDTPGSTATTAAVLLDGVSVVDVVIPADETRVDLPIAAVGVARTSALQVEVAGPGDGAESLTIQIIFR